MQGICENQQINFSPWFVVSSAAVSAVGFSLTLPVIMFVHVVNYLT